MNIIKKVAQLHIQAKSYDRVFYSPTPFNSFRNEKQDRGYTQYEKPKGLWYSCGKAWKQFAQTNNFRIHSYNHKYLLEVNLSRMCLIRNEKELLEFSEKYGELVNEGRRWAVDWSEVSRDCDGIEICPLPNLEWDKKTKLKLGKDYSFSQNKGGKFDLNINKSFRNKFLELAIINNIGVRG